MEQRVTSRSTALGRKGDRRHFVSSAPNDISGKAMALIGLITSIAAQVTGGIVGYFGIAAIAKGLKGCGFCS